MHKCEYCDKQILPCPRPCPDRNDKNHICCTCGVNIYNAELNTYVPLNVCELPESVVCDGAVCSMKLQIAILNNEIDDLQATKTEILAGQTIELQKLNRLKELTNSYRILGFGPKAFETIVQNFGINLPGIFSHARDESWTWDQLTPEDIGTLGLHFMSGYEKLAKIYASFLNERSIKPVIKADQVRSTHDKLNKISKTRDSKSSDLTKSNEPKTRVSLNPFERLVLGNMKLMQCSQADAEAVVRAMQMNGSARDLKSLRVI